MDEKKEAGPAQTERRHGPSVDEIHIDFLLWEEFESSLDFLRGFVRHCGIAEEPRELVGPVRRSVSDSSGESDLVVIYRDAFGKRIGLLIEDKIGAALQHQQAERYQSRGESGLEADWDAYVTCLVAPKKYADRVEGFDATVSLEQVAQLLSAGGDGKRDRFKQLVIQVAIAKERLVGPKVIDAAVTSFRRQYYELLQKEFPDFKMSPPREVYAGETWFHLNHGYLDRPVFVHHKSREGYVDLNFPEVAVVKLEPLAGLVHENGWKLERTGKSASIRAKVSQIRSYASFSEESSKVREALEAANQLTAFYVRERDKIRAAIA